MVSDPAFAGRAYARILDFELFEVRGLGRAASPRPPSWANGHTELSAGVLGETALPRFLGLNPVVAGL